MKIGDKVRLTKGTETGFIVGQVGNGVFDVDLEDGFVLQLHITEITVIEEAEYNEVVDSDLDTSKNHDVKETLPNEKGLIFAADFKDNRTIKLIAKNNTKYSYHIFIYKDNSALNEGILSDIINTNSTINIRITKDGNSAPTILIKFIKFNVGEAPFKLREYTLNLNDKSSFDGSEGHIYSINIDSEDTTQIIDPQDLKNKLFQGSESVEESRIEVSDEIDLHIEKLNEGNRDIAEENILSIQLSAFQTALDNAISSDLDHLTVIHGVGNGILRNEVHKRLANRGDIAWFKDADKQKFGFGATYIQLK